jgi:hypothetical protein
MQSRYLLCDLFCLDDTKFFSVLSIFSRMNLSHLFEISLHCEAIRGKKMLQIIHVKLPTSNFVANLRESYNQNMVL